MIDLPIRPRTRSVAIAVCAALLASTVAGTAANGWSPQRAAAYLDARQKAWFAWDQAYSPDGPCVSCHTGLTYLLARPALRKVLNENEPTMYERGLLGRLKAHIGSKSGGALQGVEAVFAAFLLAPRDGGVPGTETSKAFEHLWTLQVKEGGARGAWPWYAVNLNPYEHAESAVFGGSLAALAIGAMPAAYRNADGLRENVAALESYLQGAASSPRPLHDRAAILWASSTLPSVMSPAVKRSLVDELLSKQGADGGWSVDALGPWSAHADAPPVPGSSSYATAYTAYVLERAGIAPTRRELARALDWLEAHQDAKTGAWPAVSMNKRYPADSMESLFMQDAATGFASLALLDAGR